MLSYVEVFALTAAISVKPVPLDRLLSILNPVSFDELSAHVSLIELEDNVVAFRDDGDNGIVFCCAKVDASEMLLYSETPSFL